jgi:hypothetical protein
MKYFTSLVLSLTLFVTTLGFSTPASATKDRCIDFKDEALAAGWSESDWPILDKIIWRESRCKPNVRNKRGRDDSYGLMQLNMKAHRKWVRPLVTDENGFADFDRLYDPLTNLTIARVLYEKADDMWGCGWRPWHTRKTKWCK